MIKTVKIIFIICFIIFLVSCCYQKIKSPFENIFPISMYKIQSGSMLPEIEVGEIVVLCKSNKYKEQDIITYKMDNSYFITHRIIKITKDGYITKGDFNNTLDESIVMEEQIQGKVIFHSKLLGKIYEFRYFLIILLSILIFI